MTAVSDLHFGQPRIQSQDMYEHLREFLYPQLADSHLLVIAGDIYDQLLTVNSKPHYYASRFFSDIMQISAKTGMQVRLLHGTYTHDRNQLTVFQNSVIPGARVKVINEISVETINDFRCGLETINTPIQVGYLPDNLSYKLSEDAVEHLQRNMTVAGCTTLDLLVGHGTFEHVIPVNSGHRPPCCYRVDQFEDIVKGPIIMGHIHTPSRRGNVYYCGSFERMAHGEEENKGFLTLTRDIRNVEGWRCKFHVNSKATLFKTLTPEGEDYGEISNNFITLVENAFKDDISGFVRVAHNKVEVRTLLHKLCTQKYPALMYSSKALIDQDDTAKLKVDDISLNLFDDIKPDVHNLGGLVCQFLEENNLLEGTTKENVLQVVSDLISEQIN